MTWYFYDDTTTPWDQIRRGHEISEPENVALVEEASAAMAKLGIGPDVGQRFQTMLKEGEVLFVGIDENDRPILAVRAERTHLPHLTLLGQI